MYPIRPTILPPPEALKNDVECVRVARYGGGEEVELQVSPTGVPGLVFHQSHGRSALEQIVTRSGRSFSPPPLFLYGPIVESSVYDYPGYFQALCAENALWNQCLHPGSWMDGS